MESARKIFKCAHFNIEYFSNQYNGILLLLHFGIWDLPPEIVYKILREYVYITLIRINTYCVQLNPCRHVAILPGVTQRLTHSSVEIRNWFEKRGIPVLEHFKYAVFDTSLENEMIAATNSLLPNDSNDL